MPVEEQLATIFEVLEGGTEVPAGEIVQFPTDVATAPAPALEGTTTTVELGNGIATEVSQLTVTEAGTTTTAGVGLLAMDVGAVGLAIAPALGIVAGIGLYNLAPEFWTNVSNRLLEAGQTIGGKVRLYINGDTKKLGVSEKTLEIFKEAFLKAGIFELGDVEEIPDFSISNYKIATPFSVNVQSSPYIINAGGINRITFSVENMSIMKVTLSINETLYYFIVGASTSSFTGQVVYTSGGYDSFSSVTSVVYNSKRAYVTNRVVKKNRYDSLDMPETIITTSLSIAPAVENFKYLAWCMLYGYAIPPELQPDATYPTEGATIPEIYPAWTPWSVPVEGFPKVYPIEVPAINPSPDQQQAQSPQEIPDNDPNALEWLIGTLPQPQPDPNPYPEPSVNPDPDPAPEPEPIPDPEPEPTPENPVDPNPTPSPSPLPVVPDMPDTVESNAMFTVYKPSMAQVNAFGGWLWSSNIVEQIKRIWQNPLDGIISFMKVYVDAPTSGSDTIKVGILDSGVSSPVVSGQFVTVECGSLNVKEKFYNATDYSPFVAMHLYLPFIGIVELDIDEFMSGEIKVTYHIDVYTGTCLAEVKSRRSPDMPDWTIVYTFSGNASQQLPLTSAEFSGALSSLVGVVGGGLAIASGGGLGLLAGASGIAHAVSHEMVHLAHSGSLSANAGIMGARKPYLILTRRRGYDANGYNELYGYPSNKTVYLNNCSGYVKVKDIRLETVATDSERIEIESLLKAGVII